MSAGEPMTKREAISWIRRAREGLRDAEAAIKDGDLQTLKEALVEASAAPVEIQTAIESEWAEPRGIRGVS